MSKPSNPPVTLPQQRPFLPRISSRALAIGALIFIATLIAYFPAITRGGFVWDDPEHIINNHTLRTFGGLIEMWTDRQSLPQWYPLTHTSFWIEYQWWAASPIGYHITNVLLHATGAVLLWRLLVWLRIPGAALAAALFALHPVMVESVAWITERKNVLSMLFYLLALRVYLQRISPLRDRADDERVSFDTRGYAIALALFAAALLSKTVTATLPATVLVIVWWKGRAIRWRDIALLALFFVLGGLLAWNTSHLEHTHVGADPAHIVELQLSIVQRLFIAGRAIWFYAGKLVWPSNLMFIYPRWASVERAESWLWIYPIAVVVVLALLWQTRARIGRGPLAAALIFCGSLVPALGFVPVYPMRFSFVADHFQYHASAALFTLFAAILWRAIIATQRSEMMLWIPIVLLAPLAVLTFRQSRNYEDAITLWRATIARNERSWMVNVNLANAYVAVDDFESAAPLYLRAVELAPNLYDTHTDAGMVYGRRGQDALAMAEFHRALELKSDFAPAIYGIGQVLMRQGKTDDALAQFRAALSIKPFYPEANYRVARILESRDDVPGAIEHYRTAIAYNADYIDARYDFAALLIRIKQYDEAIANLLEVVRLRPNYIEAWQNLGGAQLFTGHPDDAARSFRAALSINPNFEPARNALQRLGR